LRGSRPKGDRDGVPEPYNAAEPRYAAELRNISKVYPGGVKKANDGISLGLRRGEILCVAGENGAGKTTLMKILSGLETPDSGEIYIHGRPARIDSPLAAKRLGIGMAHQHFSLFPEYTVAENIVMGMEPRRWGIFFDGAGAEEAARKVIDAHCFSIVPNSPVFTLSVGEMQQVEICRLLYRNADIIILDEPTAALTGREIDSLFKTLKTLASAGKSLILITHKLREIKLISDRVAVLRRGRLVGIHDTAHIDEREISRMMVGDFEKASTGKTGKARGPGAAGPVIVFDNVTLLRRGQGRPLLDGISFAVRAGEILGFAGVGGNGLGVLEAALGGFLHPATGKILHRGKDISRLNIRRLRNRGLAYVPADRLRVGSAPGATVEENMIVNRRHEFTRLGFFDRKGIRFFTDDLIRRYGITGTDSRGAAGDAAAFLSGGNLQKLILAREIDRFMDYIVFSEPTWGLDIAAGDFVWREIIALRANGAAVIIISTNLDEILEYADRIIVMYRGRAAGDFLNTGDPALKEKIGACMQGLPHNGAEE
jgi:simple sugar transport system ATP-binding protein